jgi:hypothetical protein
MNEKWQVGKCDGCGKIVTSNEHHVILSNIGLNPQAHMFISKGVAHRGCVIKLLVNTVNDWIRMYESEKRSVEFVTGACVANNNPVTKDLKDEPMSVSFGNIINKKPDDEGCV